MEIAIVGTGALAAVLSDRLSRVGHHEVSMVGTWERRLDAIRNGRLRVLYGTPLEETRHAACSVATGDVRVSRSAGLVIFAVKGYVLRSSAEAVRRSLARVNRPVVFGVQNGLTAWESLQDGFGANAAVLGAETTMAATNNSAEEVRVFGLGTTWIGPLDQADGREAAFAADTLAEAGIPTVLLDTTALEWLRWNKTMLAAGLNATSIILRAPVSSIRASASASRIARRAMQEVGTLAESYGIALDVDAAVASMADLGDNRPSGLQDFLIGKRTEVGDINGEIARRGLERGVHTPYNELLDELVSALYETAAERISDNDIPQSNLT